MLRLIGFLVAAAVLGACSDNDREARRRAAGPRPSREDLLRVASGTAGGRLFRQCAACHSIRSGESDRDGPNLFAVMEKPVAWNRPRFSYTDALRAAGGRWTAERMDAWLTSPNRFAPGTSMSFPGLRDPLDRADVIAYLQAQR